jgi:hypothetical protein
MPLPEYKHFKREDRVRKLYRILISALETTLRHDPDHHNINLSGTMSFRILTVRILFDEQKIS